MYSENLWSHSLNYIVSIFKINVDLKYRWLGSKLIVSMKDVIYRLLIAFKYF